MLDSPKTDPTRRFPVLLAIVATVAFFGLAAPRAYADRWVDTAGVDVANNCTIQVSPCASIQNAASQATQGETVFVAAGTYAESPVVTIGLRFMGAKAGQDARLRDTSSGESILAGTLLIRASSVIFDGFTIANPSGPAVHADTTNVVGATIENIFVNGGPTGLLLERALTATVRRNLIKGVTGTAIDLGYDAGTATPADDVLTVATVENNEVVNSTFGIAGYMGHSFVRWNEVRGYAGPPPGAALSGQLIDTVIESNTLTGYTQTSGVRLAADPQRRLTEDAIFKCNTITGNLFGVFVAISQADLVGVVFSSNNIEGNSIGFVSDTAATADAIYNWWGCATGPGTSTCDLVIGPAAVVPFLTAQSTCSGCFQDVDCDDGLICNGTETCNIGSNVCEAGTAPTCGTGNADAQCNVASCEEGTGCIVTALEDNTPCDDGAMCSEPDLCLAGVCEAGGNGDRDKDLICQDEDNCPGISNPGQEDPDMNGVGEICDPGELGIDIARIALKSAISGPNTGQFIVKAALIADPSQGDVLDASGDITITLRDGGDFVFRKTFRAEECIERKGKIKCRSADKDSKAKFVPNKKLDTPGALKVKIGFQKLSITDLFLPPGSVTIEHENGLLRFGENTGCSTNGGPILICE